MPPIITAQVQYPPPGNYVCLASFPVKSALRSFGLLSYPELPLLHLLARYFLCEGGVPRQGDLRPGAQTFNC